MMLEEFGWNTNPNVAGKEPGCPITLPPASRLVLPMITTGFVEAPESPEVSTTVPVAE